MPRKVCSLSHECNAKPGRRRSAGCDLVYIQPGLGSIPKGIASLTRSSVESPQLTVGAFYSRPVGVRFPLTVPVSVSTNQIFLT
jgi:hypothetical protein